MFGVTPSLQGDAAASVWGEALGTHTNTRGSAPSPPFPSHPGLELPYKEEPTGFTKPLGGRSTPQHRHPPRSLQGDVAKKGSPRSSRVLSVLLAG